MNEAPTKINNKLIWNIAYPIIFGSLAQSLVSFIDTAFLGHIGDNGLALGAAMITVIYYYVFSTLAWGFATGVQIIIARRFGEKNYKSIGAVFEHGMVVVGVLGVLLFVVMHFCSDWILRFMITSDDVYAAAQEFIRYRHYGIIFVCFNFLFRSTFVGLSNTKAITYTTIMMGVVNAFFDYAMIFGKFGFPEMGIGGAALASVIAEFSALVFFVIYILRVLPYKNYHIFSFQKIEFSLIKSMLKLSIPTMAQRLLSFGTWLIFFMMIERMGEESLAVSGVVRNVYMLILVPVWAFTATANTLTSRLIGEGRQKDINPTLRRITKLSLSTITPLLVVCIIFPNAVASIYTDNAALASQTGSSLFMICIAAVIMAVGMVYFEAVSGTGNTFSALLLEVIVLVLYITFLWILVTYIKPNVAWVWSCELVYGGSIGILSLLYLHFANWQKKKI